MDHKTNKIENECPEFMDVLPQWQQTRAAIAGKAEILRLSLVPSPLYRVRHTYKDSHTGESVRGNEHEVATRKEQYWNRARYFNATGRTHDTLDGMIFSKMPEVEISERLEYLKTKGIGLRAIAQEIVNNVIAIGRHGALVDMPQTGGQASIASQQSGENAPCIVTYKAEQIIYWREDEQLLEVRLLETYQEPKGELEYETHKQVRRLVLIDGVYHNQVWRGDTPYEDVTPIMNGSLMNTIPFFIFGADYNSSMVGPIPLFDLADMNIGHFNHDADNRDNLHYHGQGMTVVYTDMDATDFRMANPAGLDVGAKGLNQLQQGDKVEILQLQATGAISAAMQEDESRMVQLGAQVVTNSNTIETLGAKRIDANATTSVLKRISINCTEGIEQLLNWCAGFLGINEEQVYKLNTEFITDSMDAQMIQQLFQLVQGGKLPDSVIYETARKEGWTKLEDEELVAEIGENALQVQTTDEETARLQAEIESLREQLANANGND